MQMRVMVGERTLPPHVGDQTLLAFRSYVLSRQLWSAHTMWPHVFFKWKILYKKTSHKRQDSGFIWKPEDLVRLTKDFHVATTCWSWVTVVLQRWRLESHWSFSHSSSALFNFGVRLKKKTKLVYEPSAFKLLRISYKYPELDFRMLLGPPGTLFLWGLSS